MKKYLLHKGEKTVDRTMRQSGYIVAADYPDGENYVVEYAKCTAGITVKSVTVVFSPKWRAIEVR